jgi:hypothetical protein
MKFDLELFVRAYIIQPIDVFEPSVAISAFRNDTVLTEKTPRFGASTPEPK